MVLDETADHCEGNGGDGVLVDADGGSADGGAEGVRLAVGGCGWRFCRRSWTFDGCGLLQAVASKVCLLDCPVQKGQLAKGIFDAAVAVDVGITDW